jgi:hypothetical protein
MKSKHASKSRRSEVLLKIKYSHNATVIQSLYRGHKVRSGIQTKADSKKTEEDIRMSSLDKDKENINSENDKNNNVKSELIAVQNDFDDEDDDEGKFNYKN